MNSERGGAPETAGSGAPQERHAGRRTELPGAAASGRRAAALCVAFAFLGLGLVAVSELAARASRAAAPPPLTLLAGAATLAALAAGLCAQAAQLRHWSRRVKRRLLIGLPVALLSALMVADTFLGAGTPLGAPAPGLAARLSAAEPPPENDALVQAGWYGELRHERLLLVVTSFGDASAEARRFSRRLSRPASYATLALINLGASEPVVLNSLEVALRMDTGDEVRSWEVRPLLAQRADANAELLQRLRVPCTLAAGAMFPDLPLCQETNFPWARVTAVTVSLSSGPLTVPGRMMTAQEKLALLDRAAARPAPGATNVTAEAWFKNL